MFRNEDGTLDKAAILGTVMVLCGVYIFACMIHALSPYYEFLLSRYNFDQISAVFLLIFGGLAVIIARGMEYSSRIAIAGLVMGLIFMLRNLGFTEFYGAYISFIVSIISFILGVVTIMASVALLCRYKFYASRLLPAVALMIGIECVPIYIYYHQLVPWLTILYYCDICFGYIAAYAMLVIALADKDIRVPSVYKKIDANLKVVKDQFYSDAETYITPDDLDRLKAFVDGGHEGKLDIPLRSRKSSRVLSVESREGSAPRASVVTEFGRSFMKSFYIDICSMAPGDEKVTIYGRNGVFIRILVHPEPEKPDIKGKIPFLSDLKKDPEEEAKD